MLPSASSTPRLPSVKAIGWLSFSLSVVTKRRGSLDGSRVLAPETVEEGVTP